MKVKLKMSIDISKVYSQLTGVNINEQKQIWDERGRGYYGEYLVLRSLFNIVPEQAKFLMNLEIPTPNGKTTEIDMIMIDASGLYVFEVKHYKGHIYGETNQTRWTQYFRTSPNTHFNSPVKQNEYHIQALNRLVPNVPIYSYVVFTHKDCVLRIQNTEKKHTICLLEDLPGTIEQFLNETKSHISYDIVDEIFNYLLQYAPSKSDDDLKSINAVSLNELIISLKGEVEEKKLWMNDEVHKLSKDYKRKSIILMTIALLSVVLFVGMSLIVANYYKTQYETQFQLVEDECNNQLLQKQLELDEMECKFIRVEDLDNEDIRFTNSFISIENVVLEPSPDIQNTVLFNCKVKCNGKNYGVRFRANSSKCVVMMKDGTIREYNIPGLKNTVSIGDYSGFVNTSFEPQVLEIRDAQIDDIAYIKIIGVSVWKRPNLSTGVLTHMELKVYSTD
jgi:hypothetical protein